MRTSAELLAEAAAADPTSVYLGIAALIGAIGTSTAAVIKAVSELIRLFRHEPHHDDEDDDEESP